MWERRSSSWEKRRDLTTDTPPSLAGPGYLEEVLGVGGEGGVEHQVMQVGVLLRTVVGKVDEVFEVIVGADVAKVLRRGC